MPFLSDIVGQATNQIKNTVQGQINSVKNAEGILVNSTVNAISNTASNVVNNGIKAVAGAAIGAVTNAVTGNFEGVVNSLNPANIIDSALSGINPFSSSSLQLAEPGYAASFSESGGVMPGDALNGALARADPQLSYLWYCQLPVVGAPAGAGGQGVNSASNALSSLVGNLLGQSPLASPMGGTQFSSSVAQLPWYYVEEATAPFRTFTDKAIFRDGRRRKYPHEYSVNNLRLGFYADVDNRSMQYLQAWNNTIVAPYNSNSLSLAGSWGRPSGYKLPIYIFLLDVNKSVLVTLQYTECWPLGIADYSLVSSSSERIVHHVDFSVGDVFVNLSNVPSEITSLLTNNPLTNAVGNLTSGLINQATDFVSNLF